AKLLGVTFQAVSKWENDTGMPDISQVVPLARLFGVSTDTLFGVFGINDSDEVQSIIKNAQKCLSRPLDSSGMFNKYLVLQEGLKQFPNNTILLRECLEAGLALSYPETDIYDAEHSKAIYRECIRYADLVISYSKKISEIMRAHMIMVMLHSAYGNFKEAHTHIEQFPARADFNIHVMYAYCSHWKKDGFEIDSLQYAIMHYIEGTLRSVDRLAEAFVASRDYNSAEKVIETAFEMIDCIFKDDAVKPPIHYRDHADLYLTLAEAYLKDGNREKALDSLERMVNYDTSDYPRIDKDTRTVSPLLRAVSREFFIKRIDRFKDLGSKLNDSRFDELKNDERFLMLMRRTENAKQ
ncbi:MAG: helix-turn-helix domain-containing protein, partial [Clostridia bacterium]|nr:helix-turn-helix domain-containing protein [Clostridia bacterium]